jgi:hypothetical protein
MSASLAAKYCAVVMKEMETGRIVAEIPALHLTDYGADVPEALDRLQALLTFTWITCGRRGSRSRRIATVRQGSFSA